MALTKEQDINSACLKYCLEEIELSEKPIYLSQDAQHDCDENKSLVLFGMIMDSASKIRLEAKKRLNELEA